MVTAAAVVGACALPVPTHAAASERQARDCQVPYMVHVARQYNAARVEKARLGKFKIHRRVLRLAPPVGWKRDPYNSRRFRAALAGLGWLDILFYDYRENGRRASLRQARDLALDWIRSNPAGNGASDRTWDDRVTATRAPYLAYAMRASACEGFLSGVKRRQFRGSILLHGRLAKSEERYVPTNHGLFVDTNLVLLARAVPALAEGRGWAATGKRRFWRTLGGRTIGPEGFWLEHSTGYQIAVWREVRFFQDLVGSAKTLADRMGEVAGWLIEPDERPLLLGATSYKQAPAEVIQEAKDDDGFLWLPRSGLAIVKRDGGYLSLASTFFDQWHKHSDELTFDLYDHGRRIVSDTGEYHKDAGRWKDFQRSPQAHSTLTVDGQPFGRNPRRAYGSGLIARGRGDGWFALLARNPLVRRQGVDHRRMLLYRPGLGLLVLDRLRADERHVYRRHFQFGVGVDIARAADGLSLGAGAWSGSLADPTLGPRAAIRLEKGAVQPSIMGFEFPAFRERLPRWAAVLRTQGEDLDHLAVLSVDPARTLEADVQRATRRRARIAIDVAGTPGELRVERDGRRLEVSAP